MNDRDLPLCLWNEVLSFMRHDWFAGDADNAPVRRRRPKAASTFCVVS